MGTIRKACGVLLVALAAVLTTVGPAAAAPGPKAVTAGIAKPSITCTGDTVSGTVRVTASAAHNVTVALLAGDSSSGFVSTGRTAVLAVEAGTRTYSYALNVAGVPTTVKQYRVRVSSGSTSADSHTLPAHRCAPAAVVPEVPSAVLLPLTLMGTGALVQAVGRRRQRIRP